MLRYSFIIASIIMLLSCGSGKQQPDTSNIKIDLQLQRFERDFFAIDTNNITAAIPVLLQKYPLFLGDFVQNILGLSLQNDAKTNEAIKMFIRDYKLVKDTADKTFQQLDPVENAVRQGLQLVKYYFPNYHTPEKLITFIGPLDAVFQTPLGKTGDVITEDALAVGLQLHLGKNASLYQSQTAQSLFPQYVSRKFEPSYIAVNCLKNVVDDVFHEQQGGGKTLLDICVDKGKRLYLLDLFMPHVADTLKLGYTAAQLKGCYTNEGLIWSFLSQQNLLYETDALRIQPYIEEGPQTQELGEGSPGNISLFVGRQLVKKYMEKFPDTPLEQLLQLDAQHLLHESKYKPK